MNQKEYEFIADTLKEIQDYLINYDIAAGIVADNLEKSYPNFDRKKFMEACGL